jgi:hypothetical protein
MNLKVFRYALSITFALFLPVLVSAQERGLDQRIDDAFKPIADWWGWLIFYPLFEGVPIVLVLLIFGAAFFTVAFGFVNIRRFGLPSMSSEANMTTLMTTAAYSESRCQYRGRGYSRHYQRRKSSR